MRVASLFLLIAFASIQCMAQTYSLQGIVTDTLKRTVENAIITLSVKDTLIGSSLTDAKGRYEFRGVKAGGYILTVSHSNYRELVEAIDLHGDRNLKHTVCPISQVNLEDVVITGDRSNVIKSNAVGTTFHLSAQARKEKSIYNSLREIPLLFVDPLQSKISSVSGGQVLVLINGMPKASSLETLDPSEVEAVEVIDNPSAKYLKDNVQMIVNLKLKAKAKPYNALNIMAMHDPGPHFGRVLGGYETGNSRYSFYIDGSWEYTDDSNVEMMTQQSGEIYRNHQTENDYKRTNFKIGVGGDFLPNEKNFLNYSVYAFGTENNTDMEGNGEVHSAGVTTPIVKTGNSKYEPDSYAAKVYHKLQINKQTTLENTLNYSYAKNVSEGWNKETGEDYLFERTTYNKAQQQRGNYAADFTHSFKNQSSLVLGSNLSLTESHIDNPLHPRFSYRSWNEYLYAGYNGRWERFSYMASVGADVFWNKIADVKDSYVRVKYTGSLFYQFNKRHSLNFFAMGNTNMPSLGILNPNNMSTDSLQMIVGNPTLKPSYTHYLGLRYRYLGGNWYIEPCLHYMLQKDIPNTIGRTQNGVYVSTYENKSKQWNLVPSLNVRYNIPNWGNVSLYTYYQRTFWETRDKGWLAAMFRWQLYYKQFSWSGWVNVMPYSYNEFTKIKRYVSTYTEVSWNFHENWNVFAALNNFFKEPRYETWVDDPAQNYHSYDKTQYSDRHFRCVIGMRFSWKNKVQQRKTKRAQVQSIDLLKTEEE